MLHIFSLNPSCSFHDALSCPFSIWISHQNPPKNTDNWWAQYENRLTFEIPNVVGSTQPTFPLRNRAMFPFKPQLISQEVKWLNIVWFGNISVVFWMFLQSFGVKHFSLSIISQTLRFRGWELLDFTTQLYTLVVQTSTTLISCCSEMLLTYSRSHLAT